MSATRPPAADPGFLFLPLAGGAVLAWGYWALREGWSVVIGTLLLVAWWLLWYAVMTHLDRQEGTP